MRFNPRPHDSANPTCGAAKIALGNLVKEAFLQLDTALLDKRRRNAVAAHHDDLAPDDEFWNFQACPFRKLYPRILMMYPPRKQRLVIHPDASMERWMGASLSIPRWVGAVLYYSV